MNKYLILLMTVIFIAGCDETMRQQLSWNNNNKHIGTMREFNDCLSFPGHYWDNEEQTCKPMKRIIGCKTLNEYNIIQSQILPIGYENITDNYDDDYLEIDIFCDGLVLKPDNTTCEEFVKQINDDIHENYYEGIAYYRFTAGYKLHKENKTIELCWS